MTNRFHILLYRAFHAQRKYLRPYLSEIGLGSGQPKLLAYLSEHGPCCQQDLAQYYEIDPSAVCRMLDTLEKGGFISRSVSPHDRRADRIQITDKGARAKQIWDMRCREMEAQLLAGFSAEEAAQFSRYLTRAYQNLKAASPGEKSTDSYRSALPPRKEDEI